MTLQNIETILELKDFAYSHGYDIHNCSKHYNCHAVVNNRTGKVCLIDVTLKQIQGWFKQELNKSYGTLL